MAERDRTDADADIEFDFFDEPPTVERTRVEPPRRETTGGGGGRPPVRPRQPGAGTPLVRLALLIGGALVLAVVLVFWVNSCRDGAKKEAYEGYMRSVGTVVRESDRIGEQLSEILTTPGLTLGDLEAQLTGLAQQQAQVVQRADRLTPPGPLVDEQESLVEAMQLRQSGLAGLARAVSQVQLATEPPQAGQTLAQQANRLIAGEVVYEDLFKGRSQQILRQEDVSGVAVPDSAFLASPELLTQNGLTELVRRIQQGGDAGGGGGGGGLHGNGIAGVRVQPAGVTLSPDEETVIAASDRLAIQVLVENSGDFQETQVRVTLTVQQAQPIRKQATIDVIGPGQTKTVTFRDFSNLDFATPTTLQVAVRPVPGEENTANNTAEYPVVFSFE